jgi:hypothetical protein
MSFLEKSDVNVSTLFNWGKEFSLVDRNGGEIYKVYIKLIGDAEYGKSRVMALRKSAELRKKLNNPESDERLAFIPEKEFIEKDKLVELIVIYSMSELSKVAKKQMLIVYPMDIPSDATLEQQEEHQAIIDNFDKKYMDTFNESLSKVIDEKKAELNKFDADQLYNDLVSNLINQLCEQELNTRFMEYCTYFGSYSDPEFKNRLFGSIDEFNNLPTEIKNQFIKHYNSLEINSEELKK